MTGARGARGFQFFVFLCSIILIGLFSFADSVYANVPEESENRDSSGQAVTVEQLRGWFLGCSSVLWERNHDHFKTLDGGFVGEQRIKDQKVSLSEWWGVGNTEDLYGSLNWINQGGHREGFLQDANLVSDYDEKKFWDFIEQCKKADPNDFSKFNDYYIAWCYGEQLGDKSLMGWDYCRYICLCRWGYICGYLDEATTWKLIISAGKKLQQTFDSWQDMGQNYLIGRRYWSYKQTVKNGDLYEDAYWQLCEIPSSPWNLYPWDMDLTNAEELILQDLKSQPTQAEAADNKLYEEASVVEEFSLDLKPLTAVENRPEDYQDQGTILIVPDQHSTIQAAIEAVDEGGIIFVKAGSYEAPDGSIENKSFQLIGQHRDQVVLYSRQKTLLKFHQCRNVTLTDLTIDFQYSEVEEETTYAVRVSESKVDLLRCRIQNPESGAGIIYSASSKGTLRDCVLADCHSYGILVSEPETSVHLINCRLNDIGGQGVIASKSGSVTIERTLVENAAGSALIATGQASSINCNECIVRSSKYGIVIWKSARGQITRSLFSDNQRAGVYIGDKGTDAEVNHVFAKNNQQSGIYVTDGAGATLDACYCIGNGKGGLRINSGKNVKVTHSVCRNNSPEGLGVYGKSGGIIIENVHSIANRQSGILFSDRAEGKIAESAAKGNQGYGILIHEESSAAVCHNETVGNREHGIGIKNSHVELLDNVSSHNMKSGIMIWGDSTAGLFEGNTCCSNGWCGIYVTDSACVTLSRNVCKDNRQEGIMVDGDPAPVTFLIENNCVNNYPSGIIFADGAGGSARGNRCEQNAWAGIAVRGEGTRPIIEGNICIQNGAWGVVCWDWAAPGWSKANVLSNNGLGTVKIR